jgi:hypothetical protein
MFFVIVAAMMSMFPSMSWGIRVADVTGLSSTFTPIFRIDEVDVVPDDRARFLVHKPERRERILDPRHQYPLLFHLGQRIAGQ